MSKLAHSNQAMMDEIEARDRMIDGEATAFAMELLMPANLVRAEIAKINFDIEDDAAVLKLARKFRVDPQVMVLRIGQLIGSA